MKATLKKKGTRRGAGTTSTVAKQLSVKFSDATVANEQDDTECLFCGELYSQTQADGWIQCTTCKKWAHDDCAGVDVDDNAFVCDICK